MQSCNVAKNPQGSASLLDHLQRDLGPTHRHSGSESAMAPWRYTPRNRSCYHVTLSANRARGTLTSRVVVVVVARGQRVMMTSTFRDAVVRHVTNWWCHLRHRAVEGSPRPACGVGTQTGVEVPCLLMERTGILPLGKAVGPRLGIWVVEEYLK